MTQVIGFIGVGTIAAALVRALLRLGRPDSILLSPRSNAVVAALEAEGPNVYRAASNAAVVDGSDIVFLTVRPPQLREAVAGLTFRGDQIVISCLANTPLQEVAALVAPANVCRLIALPVIERGAGPLVLYPPLPAIRRLFGRSGELIEASTEAEFAAYAAASATMSTFFALQAATIRWLIAHCASTAGAESYVRSMQLALAQTAMPRHGGLDALVEEHETPGGINERLRLTLDRRGWFDAITVALDGVGEVEGSQLQPGWRTGATDKPGP